MFLTISPTPTRRKAQAFLLLYFLSNQTTSKKKKKIKIPKKPNSEMRNYRITSMTIGEFVVQIFHLPFDTDGFSRTLDRLNSQRAPRFQVNYRSAIGYGDDPQVGQGGGRREFQPRRRNKPWRCFPSNTNHFLLYSYNPQI